LFLGGPFHSRHFNRMARQWSYWFILANMFLAGVTAHLNHIRTVDAQQDERIRLECTVTSKLDAEEVSCQQELFSLDFSATFTGGESI
jgi:hypothetical protein